MITWFMIKDILYDLCIEDMIFSGDMLNQTLGILLLPYVILMALGGLLMDIIEIPFYLLAGFAHLTLKFIERKM